MNHVIFDVETNTKGAKTFDGQVSINSSALQNLTVCSNNNQIVFTVQTGPKKQINPFIHPFYSSHQIKTFSFKADFLFYLLFLDKLVWGDWGSCCMFVIWDIHSTGSFNQLCCQQVTMGDRGAAELACKDANPIIDGRKANVNLAYLGAKPRSSQTSKSCRFTLSTQEQHNIAVFHIRLAVKLCWWHMDLQTEI